MRDVIIVGGGPAGLSAALALGRCRRSVTLFDHGRYRNAQARAVHGFLTRDGIAPEELRRVGRAELSRYPSVHISPHEVVRASAVDVGFEVEAKDGSRTRARTLVIATGLVDERPALRGLSERIGSTVFHCPYCDGWELGDQPLFAYAPGDAGARFALELTQWSPHVLLCTDGGELPSAALATRLALRGVLLRADPIECLEGSERELVVRFRDGPALSRRALFYSLGCRPRSELGRQLGLAVDAKGMLCVDKKGATSVPGVYVAGDASKDALQAIVAAGEGSAVAMAINVALLEQDLFRT